MEHTDKINSLDDVLTGDDFLVRGKGFIARGICHVMKKWAKQQKYPEEFIPLVMSHAARFVRFSDVPGIPMIFGSTESGYKGLEFEKHYNWEEDEFIIMRRKKKLTKEEKANTIRFILHLSTVSIAYQYWNFIQWLILVYLRINIFWWDRDAFTFCYESCYLSRKNLDEEGYLPSKNPDIFILLMDKNYEIVYISNKLKQKLNLI